MKIPSARKAMHDKANNEVAAFVFSLIYVIGVLVGATIFFTDTVVTLSLILGGVTAIVGLGFGLVWGFNWLVAFVRVNFFGAELSRDE